ncbi:DUF1330 domain-containing protein [Roseibium sediminicola]|uniref:DUF1330 domain-containing protein n=1 Tax=Roseibium sediminicola TaxID=2933272 RepID=A0ABT0GRX0_9HYPH|nr:DUF1330 domain-containing protein [Roseibium sp. CAU 1639]MCK7612182.1 DUF1330 domain-containing protein [Roseibium sp. CAU 1639]
MNVNEQVNQFTAWYGPGTDGSSPTVDQWAQILGRPADKPVTLINFFKLRDKADYPQGTGETSGQDAFASYASVSIPAMQRAGGRFLHVGPFQGMFLGETEDWDVVAIGTYPNLGALTALYSDESYRGAFHHRTAACERQKVLVSGEQ